MKDKNMVEREPTETGMTPEEARAIVERERRERVARAEAAIRDILERERCALNPVVTLTARGMTATVQVVAVE